MSLDPHRKHDMNVAKVLIHRLDDPTLVDDLEHVRDQISKEVLIAELRRFHHSLWLTMQDMLRIIEQRNEDKCCE